jgi:hypothetical protein
MRFMLSSLLFSSSFDRCGSKVKLDNKSCLSQNTSKVHKIRARSKLEKPMFKSIDVEKTKEREKKR